MEKEDVKEMVDSILTWWEEAKHETIGEHGEELLYDTTPHFVELAYELNERYG